jgi:hypothetical protein
MIRRFIVFSSAVFGRSTTHLERSRTSRPAYLRLVDPHKNPGASSRYGFAVGNNGRAATNSLPHLQTMDAGSAIEAQLDLAVSDAEHRDFERRLEVSGAADDHGFVTFPGKDQHGVTSCFMRE